MAPHSWKSSDFIEVKKILQIYILRINLSNKTAVSSEDSLDRGPEAPAGLCQGVPGKEPHHLLHLLDQITGLAARQCIDPLFRDATYKIVKRVAVMRARRLDLLPPHLRKVLLDVIDVSICIRPALSLFTITALVASCWFNFTPMCIIVFVYASADSWDDLMQNN